MNDYNIFLFGPGPLLQRCILTSPQRAWQQRGRVETLNRLQPWVESCCLPNTFSDCQNNNPVMAETPVTPKTLLVIADGYYSNGYIINSAWDLRPERLQYTRFSLGRKPSCSSYNKAGAVALFIRKTSFKRSLHLGIYYLEAMNVCNLNVCYLEQESRNKGPESQMTVPLWTTNTVPVINSV